MLMCNSNCTKCEEGVEYNSSFFYRLTRILTRLPALRLMNSSITEELFFTGLIGNVSIDSIIPYILKMETAEYNNQDSDSAE